jgi:LmbE family N-acetylglucosaminyl deacetylase
MLEEPAFIPFEASSLPQGPWLIFAPHADDETFGMGGSLLLAKEQGIETHLVVMTDGALGGEREGLVQIRQREVQAAVAMLGIASLDQWLQPDRGLPVNDELMQRAAEKISQLKPATVFFPGAYEPHPDHRRTSRIVWQALQSLAASDFQQLPEAWAYEIGVQSPINTLVDITGCIAGKKAAIDLYNSQNSENDYPDLVLSLNRARTFSLPPGMHYAEGFFRYQPAQYNRAQQAIIDHYYQQYWA